MIASGLTISVCEPVKLNDKVGSYVSYKVVTAGITAGEVAVNRRYSEFDWLQKELARTFPGVIVPSLPAKSYVGSFAVDFVESRQRGLEKFLQRIASHPDLGSHQLFLSFLQLDDASLQRTISDTKAAKPQIAAKTMNWFQSAVNTVQNSGKNVQVETSPADLQVDEIMAYIESFDEKIKKLTTNLKGWNTVNGSIATATYDLGITFSSVSKTPEGPISNGLGHVGQSCDASSVIVGNYTQSNQIDTLEPFLEYFRLVESIRYSFKKREDIKTAYSDALTDVEVKQKAYNQVLGVQGKEDVASTRQQQVYQAQSKADSCKMDYETCTERFIKEFDTLKAQKAFDMKNIMVKYAEIQLEYNQKLLQLWSDVLPQLQSISVGPETARQSGGVGSSFPPPPPVPTFNDNSYYSYNNDSHYDSENVGV